MQADPGRIMLAVRQPACLMLVADTLGERAEAVCAALAHHGRLTFRQLAQLLTTPLHEPGGSCSGSAHALPDLAASVAQLLEQRLVEQACACRPVRLA